jgi:hypothetical protein
MPSRPPTFATSGAAPCIRGRCWRHLAYRPLRRSPQRTWTPAASARFWSWYCPSIGKVRTGCLIAAWWQNAQTARAWYARATSISMWAPALASQASSVAARSITTGTSQVVPNDSALRDQTIVICLAKNGSHPTLVCGVVFHLPGISVGACLIIARQTIAYPALLSQLPAGLFFTWIAMGVGAVPGSRLGIPRKSIQEPWFWRRGGLAPSQPHQIFPNIQPQHV